jgi:hypothetical protein
VYANVRGLGDVLARKGTVEDVGVFEDFTRGFTRGKVNFDFVDVGSGKDRADEKIIGTSSVVTLQSYTDLYGLAATNLIAVHTSELTDSHRIFQVFLARLSLSPHLVRLLA